MYLLETVAGVEFHRIVGTTRSAGPYIGCAGGRAHVLRAHAMLPHEDIPARPSACSIEGRQCSIGERRGQPFVDAKLTEGVGNQSHAFAVTHVDIILGNPPHLVCLYTMYQQTGSGARITFYEAGLFF